MKFKATVESLVDDEIFSYVFDAKNEEEAWGKAIDHFDKYNFVDHGTIELEKRKPLKKISVERAKNTIEAFKHYTAYFGENNKYATGEPSNTYDELYKMFRHRYNFGEAETQCIIAALIIAGGDIRE